MKANGVTLLYATGRYPSMNWQNVESAAGEVIEVHSLAAMKAFMDEESGVDVVRVVIDKTIDSMQLLEFLSSVPPSFRGDILTILSPWRGYISAIATRDNGRMLYKLGEDDIRFYFETMFETRIERPLPPPIEFPMPRLAASIA
jgi:hypothetical protein